jgi:hypothetical protein
MHTKDIIELYRIVLLKKRNACVVYFPIGVLCEQSQVKWLVGKKKELKKRTMIIVPNFVPFSCVIKKKTQLIFIR